MVYLVCRTSFLTRGMKPWERKPIVTLFFYKNHITQTIATVSVRWRLEKQCRWKSTKSIRYNLKQCRRRPSPMSCIDVIYHDELLLVYIQGTIEKEEHKGPPSGLRIEIEILQQRPHMQKQRRPLVKSFIPTWASIVAQNRRVDSFFPYPQPLGTQGLPP